MPLNCDSNTLLGLAQRYWHKPIGAFISVLVTMLIVKQLVGSVELSGILHIVIYLLSTVFVLVVWFFMNKIPRNSTGKVGFVACIKCSDEKYRDKIKEDFIVTLRDIVKRGELGKTFNFIEIPDHIAETINDHDDALSLLGKTKSHFIVYGRVRLRTINNKECHVIDLDGAVAHKPIPVEISNNIASEFRELLPRHIHFSTENDMMSFCFTSDLTEYVAKYIMGVASACSGDLDYAELLFRDVYEKIKNIRSSFPIISKLNERIPVRISSLYESKAITFITLWEKGHDQRFIDNFIININKIPEKFITSYQMLLLRSIGSFFSDRNIERAVFYIKKCKKYNDPVWRFNLAFLMAYKGDLQKSIQCYRICEKYQVAAETISQVEGFIVWILEEEPEKYQYYFCLGFFNWKIKGDLQQSLNDFEKFLSINHNNNFEKEELLATKWCAEIKKSLIIQPSEPSELTSFQRFVRVAKTSPDAAVA